MIAKDSEHKIRMNENAQSGMGQDPLASEFVNQEPGSQNAAAQRRDNPQPDAVGMGENSEWLKAHEAELIQQHPDWLHKYVIVASRTSSKILAVAEDRWAALEKGIQSPELLELARQENLPPGSLMTAIILGDVGLEDL